MNTIAAEGPVFVLIDDHIHSARQMSRALEGAATPVRLVWLGNARRGRRSLARILASRGITAPNLIIVDLKSHSTATAEFVSEIGNGARAAGIRIVAIAPDDSAGTRDRLYESGADAVFVRHHDRDAYRSEMAELTRFWVRETLTWPIRA